MTFSRTIELFGNTRNIPCNCVTGSIFVGHRKSLTGLQLLTCMTCMTCMAAMRLYLFFFQKLKLCCLEVALSRACLSMMAVWVQQGCTSVIPKAAEERWLRWHFQEPKSCLATPETSHAIVSQEAFLLDIGNRWQVFNCWHAWHAWHVWQQWDFIFFFKNWNFAA